MSYVAPLDLLNQLGIAELHSACAQHAQFVSLPMELLEAVLRATSTSAYTAEQIDLANTAALSLSYACTRAIAHCDAVLASRWPSLVLPIATPSAHLRGIAFDLARYWIHDAIHDVKESLIYIRAQAAERQLSEFAKGLTTLGVAAPVAPAIDASAPISSAPAPVFTPEFIGCMP